MGIEEKGFPGGSDGKASVCNAGDPGLIPGLGRSPEEGNGSPLRYFCLEKSHGWRSLVGYSPWSRKESDMTEQFHFHFDFQRRNSEDLEWTNCKSTIINCTSPLGIPANHAHRGMGCEVELMVLT